MEKDPTPFEHEQDTQRTHVNEEDEILVPVHEEEVSATKRQVERGSVTIRKDVIEEEQTIEVPLVEEEVHVSRHPVEGDVAPADNAFDGKTVSIPVHGEELEVEKRTRVREEIDITKEPVTHTEQVTDTVRREEVIVDGEPDVQDATEDFPER